jgi:hypothetical protein
MDKNCNEKMNEFNTRYHEYSSVVGEESMIAGL